MTATNMCSNFGGKWSSPPLFPPGFATDSHCLFHGIVKPSFKTIVASPLLLLLARNLALFLVHSVIAKPELVDVVNMLLHCCITLSTMLNMG